VNVAKTNIWTVPHGGGWGNRREDGTRVAKIFKTKAEAVGAGRRTATREKVEHVILNRDGTIGERNSYGNDSRRSKG